MKKNLMRVIALLLLSFIAVGAASPASTYIPKAKKAAVTAITATGSGTYTTPAGATELLVLIVGSGGGGAAGGTQSVAPTSGAATVFGSFSAAGGIAGANAGNGGAGGAPTCTSTSTDLVLLKVNGGSGNGANPAGT